MSTETNAVRHDDRGFLTGKSLGKYGLYSQDHVHVTSMPGRSLDKNSGKDNMKNLPTIRNNDGNTVFQ